MDSFDQEASIVDEMNKRSADFLNQDNFINVHLQCKNGQLLIKINEREYPFLHFAIWVIYYLICFPISVESANRLKNYYIVFQMNSTPFLMVLFQSNMVIC